MYTMKKSFNSYFYLSNCRISRLKICFLCLVKSVIIVLLYKRVNVLIAPYLMVKAGVENRTNVMCEKCFSASFDFSVDIPNLCHDDVTVVIAIHVSADRLATREVIRNTWLSRVRGNTSGYSRVRYFFLLGRPENEETRRAILNESQVHQDIVGAEFVDTYRNLTLKTVLCMKWLASRCPHAQYFLKTDDDVWVDVDNLLATVKQYKDQLHTSLAGRCRSEAANRNQSSKWYVSTEEFPGDVYDPFCSGTGYVGSLLVAKRVADIYVKVPYYHLEDVYMGMCLKALGYSTVFLPRFYNPEGPTFSDCWIKMGHFVTSHKIPADRMQQIHNSTCNKV